MHIAPLDSSWSGPHMHTTEAHVSVQRAGWAGLDFPHGENAHGGAYPARGAVFGRRARLVSPRGESGATARCGAFPRHSPAHHPVASHRTTPRGITQP